MNYDDIIRYWKTQQAAANAIGVSQATVCRWHTTLRGQIPLDKQVVIDTITGGRLKVDRKRPAPRRRGQLVPA